MKRMMITLLWALLSFCLLMDNVAAQNYTLTVQVYRAGTTDPLGGLCRSAALRIGSRGDTRLESPGGFRRYSGARPRILEFRTGTGVDSR